ncbi:MAG: hypothetical protein RR513_09425 [Muribaculaceae bacterium]
MACNVFDVGCWVLAVTPQFRSLCSLHYGVKFQNWRSEVERLRRSPLHYTTLHYTTLHYTTLHYTHTISIPKITDAT